MLSWLIIGILAVLLVFSLVALFLYRWDLKKMTEQLEEIIEHFGTNELVRTNISNKPLNRFVTRVNRLITLFKQDQQQSQKKTQELKQEITNISHDLRTPLTSIKGFSDLLMDGSLSADEKQEYLDIIQKKIDTLTMTVDLFYEISKLESADEQLMMARFSLEQVLVESVLAFHQDFEQREIQVSIDDKHLSELVWGDEKATKRIIINILQNALRYAKSCFTLNIVLEQNFLVLQAQNDTENFDVEKIDRIFDRSFTLDASRKDGQTGLGLYILRKLSEKQGGKAAAEYKDGNFVLKVWFPR